MPVAQNRLLEKNTSAASGRLLPALLRAAAEHPPLSDGDCRSITIGVGVA